MYAPSVACPRDRIRASRAIVVSILVLAERVGNNAFVIFSSSSPGATPPFCALCTVMWPIEQSGLRLSRRAAAGPATAPRRRVVTRVRAGSCRCRPRAATGAISPRAADRVTASACRPRGRNDHADGSPGTAIRTPSALLLLAVYAFDHLRGAIGIVSDRRYVDCMRMACLACKCSPQRGAIVKISKTVRAVVCAAYRAPVQCVSGQSSRAAHWRWYCAGAHALSRGVHAHSHRVPCIVSRWSRYPDHVPI